MLDKTIVQTLVDVDALDRAATLAAVVHRAVGQAFGGAAGVGILTHITRIFTAQLQLQLNKARRQRLCNVLPGVVAAGEKQAVDVLLQQRLPDLSRAHQAGQHGRRHTGCMQQAQHVLATQGGVFAGLVEHRVAGQKRRQQNIVADEVRVVPGRDVGHHTQRRVCDLLLHTAAVKDLFVAHGALGLLEEKVDAAEQPVQFIARLADRFAHFLRQRARQAFEFRHHPCAVAADDGQPLGKGQRRPGRLRHARLRGFVRHARRVIRRQRRDERAGGGVVNIQRRHDQG